MTGRIITRRRVAGLVAVAAAAAIAGISVALAGEGQSTPDGRDSGTLEAQKQGTNGIGAYFVRESYGPGDRAKLVVYGKRAGLTVQIFRTGSVPIDGRSRDTMVGAPVHGADAIRRHDPHGRLAKRRLLRGAALSQRARRVRAVRSHASEAR